MVCLSCSALMQAFTLTIASVAIHGTLCETPFYEGCLYSSYALSHVSHWKLTNTQENSGHFMLAFILKMAGESQMGTHDY